MPINSRAKGQRAERAFCQALFDLYKISARRSQQYCGSSGDAADIVSDLEAHLEIKHVERLNLAEAYDQARADSAKQGRVPVVCHKKNKGPWMITMALSDLGPFINKNKHLFEGEYEKTNGSNKTSFSSSSSVSDDEFSSNPMLKE